MFKKIKEKLNKAWNWVKTNVKKVLITIGVVGIATAAGVSQLPEGIKLSYLPIDDPMYQAVNWVKPTTEKEWLEDVKKESLNLKHDYQLDEMQTNLTDKLPKLQKELDRFVQFPDYVKFELTERFSQQLTFDKNGNCEGKTLKQWVDGEFQERLDQYTADVAKVQQSLERIGKEKELRITKKVDRTNEILGTTYYIDCDSGSTSTIGTSTSAAGRYLDQFTEVARSAGDKVIVKRGHATSSCINGTDLNFTSDGTIVAPIVIEADFDNAWADYTTSTASAATLVFGTTTITMTTTTGITAGKWIYNITDSDNPRDYAYEVASVGATGITLYLPFKGTAGASKTLRIMPDNPIWNTATGDFQWNFDTDNYWKVQGINIGGTDANGQVEIDSSLGHEFIDCIFIGNDVTAYGIYPTDDSFLTILKKIRTQDETYALYYYLVDTYGETYIYNSIIQSDNSFAIYNDVDYGKIDLYSYESTIGDSDSTYGLFASADPPGQLKFLTRNSIFTGSTAKISININSPTKFVYNEDYQNIIGDNRQFLGLSTAASDTPQVLSTSTTVRSGGGATSLELRPTTNFSTNWDFSRVQLFEYPIYADTTSKTYSMYFRSSATANWTADPTASELWIECEYWGHATNVQRRLTKSTGTLDFNGTTTWNALSVTCQPSQNGILYLRSFYSKTKEAGSNIFFMDVQPVVQ